MDQDERQNHRHLSSLESSSLDSFPDSDSDSPLSDPLSDLWRPFCSSPPRDFMRYPYGGHSPPDRATWDFMTPRERWEWYNGPYRGDLAEFDNSGSATPTSIETGNTSSFDPLFSDSGGSDSREDDFSSDPEEENNSESKQESGESKQERHTCTEEQPHTAQRGRKYRNYRNYRQTSKKEDADKCKQSVKEAEEGRQSLKGKKDEASSSVAAESQQEVTCRRKMPSQLLKKVAVTDGGTGQPVATAASPNPGPSGVQISSQDPRRSPGGQRRRQRGNWDKYRAEDFLKPFSTSSFYGCKCAHSRDGADGHSAGAAGSSSTAQCGTGSPSHTDRGGPRDVSYTDVTSDQSTPAATCSNLLTQPLENGSPTANGWTGKREAGSRGAVEDARTQGTCTDVTETGSSTVQSEQTTLDE